MGGIRPYQRSIARHAAEQNKLKANKKYKNKDNKIASGLKIAFKALFGKEKKSEDK